MYLQCSLLLALYNIRQREATAPYQGGRFALFSNGFDISTQILNEHNVVIHSNPSPDVPPAMKFRQESKRHANNISHLRQLPTEFIVDIPEYEAEHKRAYKLSILTLKDWKSSYQSHKGSNRALLS
jgi:hypothetical protein